MLKNRQGQGVVVQYALTFALVLAVITAMSVYFKRVVQSRFPGAALYANRIISETINTRLTADPDSGRMYNLVGNFAMQYEPYYAVRSIDTERSGTIIDREQAHGITGIQSREYQDYQTTMRVMSNQLAPKDAY